MQDEKVELAVMANDISYIKNEIEKISKRLHEQYVTKTEFEPTKKIVWGLVMIVLITVVVGVINALMT